MHWIFIFLFSFGANLAFSHGTEDAEFYSTNFLDLFHSLQENQKIQQNLGGAPPVMLRAVVSQSPLPSASGLAPTTTMVAQAVRNLLANPDLITSDEIRTQLSNMKDAATNFVTPDDRIDPADDSKYYTIIINDSVKSAIIGALRRQTERALLKEQSRQMEKLRTAGVGADSITRFKKYQTGLIYELLGKIDGLVWAIPGFTLRLPGLMVKNFIHHGLSFVAWFVSTEIGEQIILHSHLVCKLLGATYFAVVDPIKIPIEIFFSRSLMDRDVWERSHTMFNAATNDYRSAKMGKDLKRSIQNDIRLQRRELAAKFETEMEGHLPLEDIFLSPDPGPFQFKSQYKFIQRFEFYDVVFHHITRFLNKFVFTDHLWNEVAATRHEELGLETVEVPAIYTPAAQIENELPRQSPELRTFYFKRLFYLLDTQLGWLEEIGAGPALEGATEVYGNGTADDFVIARHTARSWMQKISKAFGREPAEQISETETQDFADFQNERLRNSFSLFDFFVGYVAHIRAQVYIGRVGKMLRKMKIEAYAISQEKDLNHLTTVGQERLNAIRDFFEHDHIPMLEALFAIANHDQTEGPAQIVKNILKKYGDIFSDQYLMRISKALDRDPWDNEKKTPLHSRALCSAAL